MSDRPPGRQSAGEAAASLWRTLLAIWKALPGVVSDRVHLFALELQQARQSLAMIVALLAGAAVLLFTGWLALWVGLVVLAIDAGLDVPWAVGVAVLLNFGGAGLLVWRASVLLPTLTFPATMRRLTLSAVPDVTEPMPKGMP